MSLSEPLCPRPYPPTRRASRPTPAPLLFVVDRALDPLHELRGEFHLMDLAGMGGRLLEDLLHRLAARDKLASVGQVLAPKHLRHGDFSFALSRASPVEGNVLARVRRPLPFVAEASTAQTVDFPHLTRCP